MDFDIDVPISPIILIGIPSLQGRADIGEHGQMRQFRNREIAFARQEKERLARAVQARCAFARCFAFIHQTNNFDFISARLEGGQRHLDLMIFDNPVTLATDGKRKLGLAIDHDLQFCAMKIAGMAGKKVKIQTVIVSWIEICRKGEGHSLRKPLRLVFALFIAQFTKGNGTIFLHIC